MANLFSTDGKISAVHTNFLMPQAKQAKINGEMAMKPPRVSNVAYLEIDQKTPDKHVKRDERMIRLTGIHPFNSEAPLELLRDQGYLTPQNLFYVRNHGDVPKVNPNPKWVVEVCGLVENPVKVELSTITQEFDQISFPVTLACAGNRRKEQNIVKKGNGFNWGSAGVSTAIFTGTLLSNLINLASPSKNAKYVCMEGKDVLPNGHYGTCVLLKWVMDPSRKIILAHKLNGQDLEPDHGFPLRVIVPGCIGGRSVKWLTKLTVTDCPSENYYHVFDNRVLPTMVTSMMAKENKDWWKDERFAIYHLNVQSVITFPGPEEILSLDKDTTKISGYAYSGGGRRIGRVEVSFDKGATWLLTKINYPEDDFRKLNGSGMFGGKIDLDSEFCYTWCFWDIEVESGMVKNAKDIVVRAMDDGMNVQQRGI
jgi:nitrate reductase (NAD(P)H)